MKKIFAPWRPETVAALNAFQVDGPGHPFTCRDHQCAGKDQYYCEHGVHINSGDCAQHEPERWMWGDVPYVVRPAAATGDILLALGDGWKCPTCGGRQYWAWDAMAGLAP